MPTKPTGEDEGDESELFDEIRSIVFWENAGFATDWTIYPFEYQRLFAAWRDAERQIKEVREMQTPKLLEAFLKAFTK